MLSPGLLSLHWLVACDQRAQHTNGCSSTAWLAFNHCQSSRPDQQQPGNASVRMSPLRLEPLMFAVEFLAAATFPSGLMLQDLMPWLLHLLQVRPSCLSSGNAITHEGLGYCSRRQDLCAFSCFHVQTADVCDVLWNLWRCLAHGALSVPSTAAMRSSNLPCCQQHWQTVSVKLKYAYVCFWAQEACLMSYSISGAKSFMARTGSGSTVPLQS